VRSREAIHAVLRVHLQHLAAQTAAEQGLFIGESVVAWAATVPESHPTQWDRTRR